mmetsp:Transcript_28009/g.56266  ORF Transcript_28009/g.56266 Transcript_28009/m.56266 type:complete len:175 (-) Transcript_28009:763-1287(-)
MLSSTIINGQRRRGTFFFPDTNTNQSDSCSYLSIDTRMDGIETCIVFWLGVLFGGGERCHCHVQIGYAHEWQSSFCIIKLLAICKLIITLELIVYISTNTNLPKCQQYLEANSTQSHEDSTPQHTPNQLHYPPPKQLIYSIALAASPCLVHCVDDEDGIQSWALLHRTGQYVDC